jgi:hypothetical protein
VATATTSVSVRPLAVPNEHGGWGILLEPLLIGLIVAPSMGGAAIAVAIVGAFFLRHPLKLAGRDWLQRRRYPRTIVCEQLIAAYGFIVVTGISFAAWRSDPRALLPLVAAIPLAAAQFAYDVRNRGRELTPELLGALGAGAGGAACVLAGGGVLALAALVWLFAALRSVAAILHVRALLRRRNFTLSIVAHSIALSIVLLMSLWTRITAPIVAIFALLLLRAISGPLRAHIPRPSTVGIEEVVWGIVAAGAIAIGLRM